MANAAIAAAGNTKLGPLVHGWSIPAGLTCPGESLLCSSRCYAKKGFFVMPSVTDAHKRNLVMARDPDFVDWMKHEIRREGVRVMRVHVSGDFFDIPYIRKWYDIMQAARRVQFFMYTRSWRVEELLPDLIGLSQLPNVALWWSIDRQTGPAPLVQGIRRAYMAINDIDASLAPNDCDLVFRDLRKTVMKKGNGVLVCPTENGVQGKLHHTCTTCGFCWAKHRSPLWEKALNFSEGELRGAEIQAPAKKKRRKVLA